MVRTAPEPKEVWEQLWGADFTNFVLSLTMTPCWVCKTPTPWIELSFEAHLCPGECNDIAWRDYFKALKSSDPSPMDFTPDSVRSD